MQLGLYLAKLLLAHPERPNMHKRRIACIGDSITFGAGVQMTRKTDAWTYLWQRRLGDGFQVLNYGVSGATLQREGDFPYRMVGFLHLLEKARPEMIVLMLGTNDAKPYNWDENRFAREFEEFVAELLGLPWPHRLALMTPPKVFPEEQTGVIAFDIELSPIRDSIRPLVYALGKRYSLSVVDLYELTEEHPEFFSDGVHPNVLGNQMIAERINRELPAR